MKSGTIRILTLFAALSLLLCAAAHAEPAAIQKMPIVIGGFDPDGKANLPALLDQLKVALPLMKSVGATSHEGYVRWGLIEPSPGKFDFSIYDSIVDLYKKNGLKWVPFLIIGSPYSLPDWYFNSDEQQGYVCLEHGKETHVQSLWNPAMRKHLDSVIKAFAEHYRDTGVVESVLLGITGNYGEAIYPATGNDWTNSVHGEYHAHAGFWAGDKYAVKSFRAWLETRYSTIDKMNSAWKSKYASFEEVNPALRDKMPSDRAWHDFMDWYHQSMSDYTEFWVSTTRKYFPKTPIYICTGGDANPMHGSDFGAQARIAAKYGAGVRITNEGSDYPINFTVTRWVASASRFYGAYFGFEPAGTVNAGGIVARVYNVTASGAAHLHTYYGNIFDTPEQKKNWERDINLFQPHKPVIDIAVYYSKPSVEFGAEFYTPARELRDYFDYDIVDDTMMEQGALKNYVMLVWPAGNRADEKTFKTIADWIEGGGTLIYASSSGPMRNIDNETPESWPAPLAFAADEKAISLKKGKALGTGAKDTVFAYGKGHMLVVPGTRKEEEILKRSPTNKLLRLLFTGKLGFKPATREAIDLDWDSIYFSLADDEKNLLVLSQNASPKTKNITIGDKVFAVETKPDTMQILPVGAGN